ncbi:MAG: hypothetical protein JRD69_10030 [Deltaproteobacteria bacterium]|nr:hypothetical protein [Deltaproteobacteria bacterium]
MGEEKVTTIAGKTMIKATFYGPSSYTTGGVYQRIAKLKDVDVALGISMSGGYVPQIVPDAYTGNALKYKVFYASGASGKPLVEVKSGTALTGQTVETTVIGD